jgi:hypothetical protein
MEIFHAKTAAIGCLNKNSDVYIIGFPLPISKASERLSQKMKPYEIPDAWSADTIPDAGESRCLTVCVEVSAQKQRVIHLCVEASVC